MMDRITCIKEKLAALHPVELQVIDESHKHAGHAGARSGGGHYLLQITSDEFSGKSKMDRHRMIYSALAEMMQQDIHALTIVAKTCGEAK
ncbi:MAG: BolA family protein [Gallionella sp.]